MAVLAATNAVAVYQAGMADKVALIALRNVNTGDTLDVGPSGINTNQTVTLAVAIGVKGGAQIACSFTGTVITMPSGMTNDFGYLLVYGAAGT